MAPDSSPKSQQRRPPQPQVLSGTWARAPGQAAPQPRASAGEPGLHSFCFSSLTHFPADMRGTQGRHRSRGPWLAFCSPTV